MADTISIFNRLEDKKIQQKLFAVLDKKYYYADLTTGIRKMSSYFQQKGLTAGDRLIISTADNYAASLLFLACLRNGLTAMLLDPEMGRKRAWELIHLTQPKGLLVDTALVEKWELTEEAIFVLEVKRQVQKKGLLFKKVMKAKSSANGTANTFPEMLEHLPLGELPVVIDPASIAYILFTSGSTSIPKAVQISHKALWANLETIARVYHIEADDRVFNILTTYHTDGIIQGPVLAALTTHTWYHPFEFSIDKIEQIFDSIYKHRITHFITVPTMLAFLHKFADGFEDTFDNEDFKCIVTSASPFEKALWTSFEQKFNTKVVNNYGLTETVAGASYCGPDDSTRKVGSIGKPIDCTFKIIDENGTELGPHQKGELLIKGENLLTNYLNNEEATRAALQGDWFYTGDMAMKDEEGIYYLVGRKKNLIISGGINIQPEEVTAILNTHPAVVDSASLGVPDELFGERLVAAVVLDTAVSVDELALINHCRTELEEAKVPTKIYFLDELPRTVSGKVRLRDLEQLLLAEKQGKSASKNTYLDGILGAAADAFKVPKHQLDMNGSSQTIDGWDSMAHLLFVTNLEEQFKVRFNSKEIMVMNTLADAAQILTTKLS